MFKFFLLLSILLAVNPRSDCGGLLYSHLNKRTMKQINFTAIPIADIEGNTTPQNVAPVIGNLIFNMADDVAESEFGIEIYHSTAAIDIDDKKEAILKRYLPLFRYNLRKSIEALLFIK